MGFDNLIPDFNTSFHAQSERNVRANIKKKSKKLTYQGGKTELTTLDLLKHKPFFIWRQDKKPSNTEINKYLKRIHVPHHMRILIKEVRLIMIISSLNYILINDCFITNKYITLGSDSKYEIFSAFSSSRSFYDLLHQLIKLNSNNLIQKCLLYKTDFNINYQDQEKNTLLISAIKANCWSIIELLLEKGANPNSQNVYGNTALHYAVSYKNFHLVDLLTKYGGREDISNNNNLPPWEVVNKNLEDEG